MKTTRLTITTFTFCLFVMVLPGLTYTAITAQQPDLVATPANVSPGGSVTVVYSANLVMDAARDFIAIYKVGSADWEYLTPIKRVSGATNKTLVFIAPSNPGVYHFRYVAFTGVYAVKGDPSNEFTVGGPTPTPIPTPTPRPSPSPTPVPSPSACPSPSPCNCPTPAPSATPQPTATPTPVATPIPVPTPVATPTPVVQTGSCKWYVSPNGSSLGNGSKDNPWLFSTVAGGVPEFDDVPPPPSVIKPGDKVCGLADGGAVVGIGTYVGFFRTVLEGALGNNIEITPAPGVRMILDPRAAMGTIDRYKGVLILERPYVTVRGVEITDTFADRTAPRPGGIQIAQGCTGCKLINNVIHDAGGGIDKNNLAAGTRIYGNLIYNVGADDRGTGLNQGGTGHCVYASNENGTLELYNNICANVFGEGFHIYSAGSGRLNNVDIQDNVSMLSGNWTRWHDSPYAPEGRGTNNFLLGHRPVMGANFARNFGFHREGRIATNLQFGYTGVENVSGSATDNTLIGGTNALDTYPTLMFARNTLSSNWQQLYYGAAANPVSVTIDRNTYFYYPPDCGTPQFVNGGNDSTPTQWKAAGFDLNSIINPCGVRDSLPKITIKPNIYDPNRWHVIVQNPQSLTNVSVTLPLANGDQFELRNAQDYFGPLVAGGTYQGPVSINMNGLNVAVPVGYAGLPNTTPISLTTSGPTFGVFVLIRK